MVERERLEKIGWIRGADGFEQILGKYIMKKTLELATGPRILDVGCGDGLLTKILAEHFEYVIGVDGSEEKISLAKKIAPQVEFHTSLFEDFEAVERFDSIIMINILEHIDDPVLFLEKAKNMLNPKGRVIIFVPNALSLNRRIGKLMGLIENYYELTPNDIKVGHRRFYDRDALIRDIEESGLRCYEVGGIFLKPLSNKQMALWDDSIFDALYEISAELPDYCGLIYVSVGVL